MDDLNGFFKSLQKAGFTPAQAAGLWQEKYTLASPILWSRSCLRKSETLRSIARVHLRLCQHLQAVQTPLDWEQYRTSFPEFLQSLALNHEMLKCYWSTLAMEEGPIHYEKRAHNPDAIPAERETHDWDDLYAKAHRRQALRDLCDHVPRGSLNFQSWQAVLQQTGLRSLRWSWGEQLTDHRHLQTALIQAQAWLQERVGWKGPLLGLAGRTSLALTNRGKSDGMVQIDHGGPGQTLTVGHWSIVAHEWLHTLDSSIAKHFHLHPSWCTTSLMHWTENNPPDAALIAWFSQMEQVLLMAPPDSIQKQIRKEIYDWANRFTLSLGHSLGIQEEIRLQQLRLTRGEWDEEQAETAWLRVFKEQYGVLTPKTLRTAALLAKDTAFSVAVKKGEKAGFWSEYLINLPHEDAEGRPCVPKSEGCMRYLGHPVEIMARSFEAALAVDLEPNPIWIPPQDRPNAGLIWPTIAESRYHQQGWKQTLTAINMLWNSWYSPQKGPTS